MRKGSAKPYAALATGLAALSFAAILIRYCDAPAIAIAFWRMAMVTVLFLPVVAFRRGKGILKALFDRSMLPYTLGAGFILALHFTLWISSVQMTTIASSLLLMSAQPIWAALFGIIFLKESVPRSGVWAMAVAIAGIAVIAWGDFGQGATNLLGDLLALLSGMAAAGYLTVGRHLRLRLPLTEYLTAVYGASAVFLALGMPFFKTSLTGYNAKTWIMFGLLAVFPSAIGHSLMNYAIRHMESYRVNLSILVEPVVSSILAAILFAEIPSFRFYIGACLVFAGVIVAIGRGNNKVTPEIG